MKATQVIPLDFLEGAQRRFVLPIKQKPNRLNRTEGACRVITLKDFKTVEVASR